MQLPTHVTFGVLIQLFVAYVYPTRNIFFFIVVFLLALLSHFILDSLAVMTYHPPQRQDTKFWLYWHLLVYLSGLFMIVGFTVINPLLLVGILGANLPDLWDWIFLRGLLKSQNKKLYVHKYAQKMRSYFVNYVPDLTYNNWGILPEFILIIIVDINLALYL